MNQYMVFLLLLFSAILHRCIAEQRSIYLVLMDEEPIEFRPQGERSDANYPDRLVESHDRFLESNLEFGTYTKLYDFKHIVNGFAIHTTHSQASKMKESIGVKLVEEDRGVKMMTTHTPEFLGMPEVWAEIGGDKGAGDGIVIGVVDSGINPIHPSFAHDPFDPLTSDISHFSGACEDGPSFPSTSCNGKIVSARFFAIGAQIAAVLDPKVDILSPFDAVGHGSHVASIAAGNYGVPVVVDGFFYGRASGMAPRARIAVYKAIYPTVGTVADVLAAIEQAAIDGVDILTLSIGPDEPPEDMITFLSFFDLFMLSARRAGVFIAQAAGNKGPSPYSVVSYSPWSFSVASCSTDRSYPGTLILGNGRKINGVGLSGPTFGEGLFKKKLVMAKDAIKAANGTFPSYYNEECQSSETLDSSIVKGSIVICNFSFGFYNGTSNLTTLIQTAKTLEFAGFVLAANPQYGDFLAEPIPFSIPGILIPGTTDAMILLKYYEECTERDDKGKAVKFNGEAAISEGRVASYENRAPIVSRFSSRGPDYINKNRTPVDVLKPDILAPGQQIWAAWSPMSVSEKLLSGNEFALMSGTSMAAPHIAGIAVTIKQKYPSWSPSMIGSAIATTASKFDNYGELIKAQGFDPQTVHPAAPFGFGAGLVDPIRALDPGLVFPAEFEDYISFLCSLPSTSPDQVKIATGTSCMNLNSTFINPFDLNLPSLTITALSGTARTQRIVKNVADMPESYIAGVVPPKGVDLSVDPISFTVLPEEMQTLRINVKVIEIGDDFRFGEIVLTGSLNHIVRIPVSAFSISL